MANRAVTHAGTLFETSVQVLSKVFFTLIISLNRLIVLSVRNPGMVQTSRV